MFYVLHRVATKGNPWTVVGPFPSRELAQNRKKHEAKTKGREAFALKIDGRVDTAELQKTGRLPT